MPGANNTDGIYVYAEDDPAAPFSGLLNRLGTAITAALRPASATFAAAMTLGTNFTLTASSFTRTGNLLIAHIIVTKSTAFVSNDVMFTLTAPWRPPTDYGFAGWQGIGGAAGAVGLQCTTAGQVIVFGQTGSNTQVRLTLVHRIP